MNLLKTKLTYTEVASADTEIKFAVVDAKLKAPELFLLIPPENDAAVQKRVFNLAKKILKQFKADGRVSFFATPDNFKKVDTVCQYVYDMFPAVRDEIPEIETGYDFLLVRF